MRIIISIAPFLFYSALLWGQTADKKVKSETMVVYRSRECDHCSATLDTVVYTLLDCGLYKGSNGDIGYRSSAIYGDNFERRTTYITRIYGVEQNDTLNGGLKEMKYVIDIASFRFLSYLYWADKINVYVLTATSEGGTVFLNKSIDRKSFKVLEGTDYAKDKKNVYYRGSILKGADLKTFRTINHKDLDELACDKLHIYRFGKRLSDKEINEWKLENYRK